jgi:hypothetical protein
MKRKKKSSPKRRIVRRASVAPRRRRRRRGMSEGTTLAELFNPATAKAGAQVIGAGAVGGLIAGGVARILSKQPAITRYGVEIAASFATYALLGYPSMSAGMAGAFAAQEFTPVYSKFLNEDEVMFAEEDSINELPVMLNEEGEVITLQEDGAGNMVYLNEATGETTLAEDVFLQEETFLQEGEDSIYPIYDTQYS